ncbi:hypothetical protein PIROE2DRAFT_60857 [Piromyces sp. E2]|nr:hypothetical protein PIROE2DRAFT_60857 [Piromyces sp. E2]|eukprot:OUM64181.1 hypothetical protein PIROE2DRAFT_60857 [Piromyces sp. E2]
MKLKSIIQNVLLILAVCGIEAKHHNKENEKENLPEKAVVKCERDLNCSSFTDAIKDMAYCNVTDHTCTNYCYVKLPCINDYDCNYSIGDKKKCGSVCHRNNINDTLGICLIVNKQGQVCNNNFIICEENLICDYYTDTCITKAEAQNQSGEPLFSLFLFMLIMLSLFNRQRADEDLLNNMAPNELFMVTLPNRRHQPEDDILPVYQPLGENTNEDEVIEQNLVVPESEEISTSEQNQSTENLEMVVDDDDLPLLPPTYDEAVSGYVEEEQLINNDGQNPPHNNNNS